MPRVSFIIIWVITALILPLFSFADINANDTTILGLEKIPDHSVVIVKSVEFKGNQVTRDFVLFRELEFLKGDTLKGIVFKNILVKSRKNLLNTSLFNFVTMYVNVEESEGYLTAGISVRFIERWYVWPFPILEFADRNFNVWWKSKNFERVNYGFFLNWENFRGRKEKLSTLVRFGYEEKINFTYEIPYINKKKTLGLGFGVEWAKNHEIAFKTLNNTLEYYNSETSYPLRKFSTWAEVTYRPDIHNSYLLSMKFNHFAIADTVFELNPDFVLNNRSGQNFFSLYFKYKSDFRDFNAYPLNGYYFDLIANKYGLGLIARNDIFLFNIQSTFRKYWKFSERWYLASLLTAQFSSRQKIPYLTQGGLGYGRYFVRGYEYYVINGQDFGFGRSNLKFALIPTKVFDLSFIPTQKFSRVHFAAYLNFFFDYGYVYDRFYSADNPLTGVFLYSTGLGLDLVTYYDIIFRIEYTVNKLNERGFFIHFMAPV